MLEQRCNYSKQCCTTVVVANRPACNIASSITRFYILFEQTINTINTSIAETRKARRGGGGDPYNVREKGEENRSKLCSLGGWVSTLAVILECEMYLISFWLE